MKIRNITFNDLDLDKCYPSHDPKQYSRGNRQSDILGNANASNIFEAL